MRRDDPFSVLLIGGRSGVGKSTVAWEISAQLQEAQVSHCYIEGDFLDQAHPAPRDDPNRTEMTRRNLASLWGNYAALGYRRLVYTNTVSVLEPDLVVGAMGGNVDVTGVLLTVADDIANQRLSLRETGSQYEAHVVRSAAAARHLETNAPDWVVRVPTDGKDVAEVAREVIALWSSRTFEPR
jgi:predicted kinase